MKKTLVAAILGLAAVVSVQAQGNINLYNYVNGGSVPNPIVYGVGSGGTLGASVVGNTTAHTSPFTVGFYIVAGNVAAAVNSSFNGTGFDAVAGSGLQLAAGGAAAGATTLLGDYQAGQYSAASEYSAGLGGNTLVTVVVVAYNGASYAASTVRGHSQAFTMTTTAGTEFAPLTGASMNGFAVTLVPEPSTFALAGLGLASLLIFRRRK